MKEVCNVYLGGKKRVLKLRQVKVLTAFIALEDLSYIDILGNREHITIEPEDITEMETIKSVKPTRENLKKVSKEQFQWGLFCGVFASCIVVLIGIVVMGGMH